ncbi:HlyD family secretion protein [Shewanella algae]
MRPDSLLLLSLAVSGLTFSSLAVSGSAIVVAAGSPSSIASPLEHLTDKVTDAKSQPAAQLLLTGKVSSAKSQTFSVPKAGDAWRYQIQWMLPEGSLVSPGQVVVVFDKSQVANQIEQLEASMLRVSAQEQSQSIELKSKVLQARFELKKQLLEQEKAQLVAAVPADFIAAKEYADNQFKLLQINAEVTKAKQALAEALDTEKATLAQLKIDKEKAALELAQAFKDLDSLELKAEIAGPLLLGRDPWSNKKFEVGDTVQVGRQIATVPAMEDLEVIAWVNEVDVDRLKPGQAVTMSLDAEIERAFPGQIASIGRQAINLPAWGRSNWFEVGIRFKAPEDIAMIPGMSVLVETGGKHEAF